MYLRPFGCHTNHGAKQAELVQKFENEVASEFFTPNAPDPPHWTLNLCFGVIHTIWVHLGPFGCLTKLSAKRAELVQKFVPNCRGRVFRNECNRSTPLDRKLMFLCISYYLGAFGTVWLPYKARCKTGKTSVKVHAMKSRLNFSQRTHPITLLDPKLMFWCDSYNLGAFWTVWLPNKNRCKTGRTSAKVRATKSRRNFSQRTHPIHPIGP
jgi:hypothetical protein